MVHITAKYLQAKSVFYCFYTCMVTATIGVEQTQQLKQ